MGIKSSPTLAQQAHIWAVICRSERHWSDGEIVWNHMWPCTTGRLRCRGGLGNHGQQQGSHWCLISAVAAQLHFPLIDGIPPKWHSLGFLRKESLWWWLAWSVLQNQSCAGKGSGGSRWAAVSHREDLSPPLWSSGAGRKAFIPLC